MLPGTALLKTVFTPLIAAIGFAVGFVRAHFHWLAVAMVALLPFWGLGAHDLWNPDEADHAQAARELLQEHRWAVPTIAGETFAEKPPLQMWVMKLSAMARGTDVDPFDARVPSAIGNALLVIATCALGWRAGGRWTGLAAALCAGASAEALMRARWCQVDGLFAGFFACAAVLSHRLLQKPNLTIAAGAGTALGLALLTKGPLAGALLVAAVATDALLTPEHRRAWLGRAGILLIGACVLAVAIALPWYVALASNDEGGMFRSLVHENIARFLKSQDHKNPFYYYIGGALWGSLAPMAWFLPPAVWFAFVTSRDAETVWTRDRSPLRFALAGLLGGLLLLSAASSKQGKYLLPLLPFAGVVAGDFARNVMQFGARWQKAWFTTVLSVLALVFVIFALFSLAASWFGPRADDAFASLAATFGVARESVPPISSAIDALLISGAGSFALLAVGIHTRASFRLAWFLAPLALAMGFAGARLMPALDASKSPRLVVEAAMTRLQMREKEGRQPRYAVYFPDRAADKSVESWTGASQFVYYADAAHRRPLVLRGISALENALADSQPLIFVTRSDYVSRLPPALRERLPVCFQKPVGSRTLVVVDSGG